MPSKSSKALICPRCRRLINGDEKHCPFCGLPNPASGWKRYVFAFNMDDGSMLITWIIRINLALFALSLFIDPRSMGMSYNPLHMLSPSNHSLILLGATGSLPIDSYGRWWSLLTAGFLHGGILHVGFNMLAFYQLGTLASRIYGPFRMVLIYLGAGVCGFGASYLSGVPLTIGASAAVCGLIGATLYYGKSRGGIWGQVIWRQIGGWALGIFAFGLIVPGIDNWAHVGGMLSGALIAWLVGYEEKRKTSAVHRALAIVSILATGLALAWAVLSTFYLMLLA